MKKLLFIVLSFIGIAAHAQMKSCCQPSVTAQNVVLAMNSSFAAAHLEPIPFHMAEPKGEMIKFKTADEKDGMAYKVVNGKPGNKVLFVYHEWWGLNDYIKQEAERFASEMGDITVYAVDLYDGQVAHDVPTAQKLMMGLKQERAASIVKGLLSYVGKDKEIASIGWCMGGAWSLQSCLIEGKQAKGCVMYYGMPESNIDRLKTLNCDVLGIFGTEDKFISTELVKAFEANMKTAGKKLTVVNYEADHAFANPSNPKHNKAFAEDAHAKALAYLKAHLN